MISVSIEKAAEILGVSEKTIYRYRRDSLLRPGGRGWGAGVAREDVEALRKIRDERRRGPSGRRGVPVPADVLAVKQSIDEQAARLARLRWLMGGGTARPGLGSLEVVALWAHATAGTGPGWAPHVEATLADWLGRVRLVDIDTVSVRTGDQHPWRPLLRLARTLTVAAYEVELRIAFALASQRLERLGRHWSSVRGDTQRAARVVVDGVMPDGRFIRRRRFEERRTRPNLTTPLLDEAAAVQ